MKIENLWDRRSFFTFLLRPFSWLFRFIVFIRRNLYRFGIKKSTRLSVPVIVVGNVTTGGTGKTPLVAWLANTLRSQGYRPGIVSRGFKGAASQWPQYVTSDSDPSLVGDEPVLLAARTQCPVVVAPKRVEAAQQLLANYECDVLISDDGLQHYALARDIEIAVVDGLRHFGNRLCLPAGPLREPLYRLNQVDFIVCNGTNEPGWFAMQLAPDEIYNVADPSNRMTFDQCKRFEWQAVAGIGHPERFFTQLEHLGMNICAHAFPDHYAFSQSDIEFGESAWVMMTEKDAVKCRSFADKRHWCLPVTASLSDDFRDQLLAQLKAS